MTRPTHVLRSLRGLAALAGLVLAAGCATAPRPDVYVIGVKPIPGGPLEQRVRIDLRVQNPTPQPIAATGMTLQVVVNGATLARGVSDEHFTVPALGEARTSIVTSSTLIDLLHQVEGLETHPSFDYRVEGLLYVGEPARSIPFETKGTLAPPGG
jgi:LEA14-like dessication related protein